MNPRKYLAALIAVAGLCATTAAQADSLSDIKARHVINVGVDLGQAPFGMVDNQMKQTGSDMETARLLAKDLGVDLNIVSVAPANRIPFLMTRKVDVIIASFSITEERKKQIDFSRPYAVIQSSIATVGGLKITSIKDLAGKEVAVTRGSTNDQLVTKAVESENVANVVIVRYDDNAAATNAVVSGQQDIYVVAPSLLVPVNEANPNRKITPQVTLKTFPLGIGFAKNEPALKAWLDDWVAANLQNGKLGDIYAKYHGVPLPKDIPQE